MSTLLGKRVRSIANKPADEISGRVVAVQLAAPSYSNWYLLIVDDNGVLHSKHHERIIVEAEPGSPYRDPYVRPEPTAMPGDLTVARHG